MHKNTIASDPLRGVLTRRLHDRLPRPAQYARSGALLVEVIVGCVMLGVFLLTAVPMLTWIRNSRLATTSQQVAAAELSNLMERVAALPATDRTDERLRQFTLSESAQGVLDDAQLDAAAAPSTQFPSLRRITLSLTWIDHAGQRVHPVELTAWFAATAPGPND
jgi:Tfp pilus assembly protein PilV